MSADLFIQYATLLLYVVLFVLVVATAVRQQRRTLQRTALFFGTIALVGLLNLTLTFGLVAQTGFFTRMLATFQVLLPYALLRVLDTVMIVPQRRSLLAGALLAVALAAVWLLPVVPFLVTVLVFYYVGFIGYIVFTCIQGMRRSRNVTRQRIAAALAGSLCLLPALLLTMVVLHTEQVVPLQPLADVLGLAAASNFYIAFAPPLWLRRSWQEPALRAFLSRAATLTRLPDTATIIAELERSCTSAIGASASVSQWDTHTGTLHFPTCNIDLPVPPEGDSPITQAFHGQRPVFVPHIEPDLELLKLFPALDEQAFAAMLAPITAGSRRFGVLTVYLPLAPLFVDDDLALVQVLADHAAVILESRTLIDEAARGMAREEANRLKNDFLSAAAHELKTPLTALIAQAQLLERRALRNPDAPVDLNGIRRLVGEGLRLKHLASEMLDILQLEQGSLVDECEWVNLPELAAQVCALYHNVRHPCIVEAEGQVWGIWDPLRMRQLLSHLVENAIKYSPRGGAVRLRIWQDDAGVHITITDVGIGIPRSDLPLVFERFHRGTNVDDRRFVGLGLGLYLCKGIVEQHGGRISVESEPQMGSVFHVTLPLTHTEVIAHGA